MLRPGHIKLPKSEAAEAGRAAGYERKQRWKELPGNRYTPEKLRAMSGEFADCVMVRVPRKRRVMHLA
jgi:hypothetical protein